MFDSLLEQARQAATEAYAPYSGFQVGAALLTKSGRVFTGCNVENASYGLSICAERNAIFQAVAAGERQFIALAVVGSGSTPVALCGACRQVLLEFSADAQVIMGSLHSSETCTSTAGELLPKAFFLRTQRSEGGTG